MKGRPRVKRQVNIEATSAQHEMLMYLAKETESYSTSGPNKGEPSPTALMRRITEGQVTLLYKRRRIFPPMSLFFKVVNKNNN